MGLRISLVGKLVVFLLIFLLLGAFLYNEESFSITGFVTGNENTDSPSDFISQNQVYVYEDRIVVKLSNTSVSSYMSSGSMLPTINKNANGIKIDPVSHEQINEGDIITYSKQDRYVVHRVIEKSRDNKGIYFITRGDNNRRLDERIRFSQIESVTVGVLY